MASCPLLGPLSNTTGSQTLSGNITLNSPIRLQGGGAGGTGATNFTGNIQGSSYLRIVNGRVVFSGNLSNAGGFFIGEQGNTTRVTFNGTTTGAVPLDTQWRAPLIKSATPPVLSPPGRSRRPM